MKLLKLKGVTYIFCVDEEDVIGMLVLSISNLFGHFNSSPVDLCELK